VAKMRLSQKIRLNAIYWAVLVDGFCVAILWLLLFVNEYLNIPVLGKVAQFSAGFYNWLLVLVIRSPKVRKKKHWFERHKCTHLTSFVFPTFPTFGLPPKQKAVVIIFDINNKALSL
jgi:hypothetical protein